MSVLDLRNILTEPDSAISDIVSNVGINVSPFTGGIQTVEMVGAKWKLSFSYQSLSLEHGRIFKALKSQMRSGARLCLVPDMSYIPRSLQVKGAPIISGANQAGSSLKIAGMFPNSRIFEIGDQLSYLAADGLYHMHIVTSASDSDESGIVYAQIEPPLRNPPLNGGSVELVKPCISALLTGGGEVSTQGVLISCSLEFTEALYGF